MRTSTRALNRGGPYLTAHLRLSVRWFNGWDPALDEALRLLPEHDCCPHELYGLLVRNPGSARKRTALVTERGVPVAVAGLRQIGRSQWEPVTQWLVPGIVFPARPGYLMPALRALRSDISVAWWRMNDTPPVVRGMSNLESTPVHRWSFSEDFEGYWRKMKHFKTVQNKRNRCRDFAVAVNPPGSARWVIENWSARWNDQAVSTSDPSLADRILLAEYLEGCGKHYTLVLLDGTKPIAGATNTVHGSDLVAGVIYREPEYDRYGVGDRIIDSVFSFAAEHGFAMLDIGGGHEYKKHWAPQDGERWSFTICPIERVVGKWLLRQQQPIYRKAKRILRRIL